MSPSPYSRIRNSRSHARSIAFPRLGPGWLTSGKSERFPAKACPALDAGWTPVRVQENASNQESRAPFRFNRNGKGSRVSAAGRLRCTHHENRPKAGGGKKEQKRCQTRGGGGGHSAFPSPRWGR